MKRAAIKYSFFFVFAVALPKVGLCITLNGPIMASSVTVSGNITISSMTVSSMTVSSLINIQKLTNGIKGLIVQTVYSSTTVNSNTTNTTLTPIPGMSATITPLNASDYIRISLSGILQSSFDGSNYFPNVNISIERDSTDIGQGALITTDNLTGIPVGITIADSPGDTNQHTYKATFDVYSSSNTAYFTATPVGYLLLQEIAQ